MDRGKFFRKRPRKIPYPVTVRVGCPIDNRQTDPDACLYEVMKLGEIPFMSEYLEVEKSEYFEESNFKDWK